MIFAQGHRNARTGLISPLRYQLRAQAATRAIGPVRVSPAGLRASQPGMIAASPPHAALRGR